MFWGKSMFGELEDQRGGSCGWSKVNKVGRSRRRGQIEKLENSEVGGDVGFLCYFKDFGWDFFLREMRSYYKVLFIRKMVQFI